VEVNWSGADTSRVYGVPVALEKRKLESVLVLEPSSPREDPLSPGGQGESVGVNTDENTSETTGEKIGENTRDNLLHIPLGKISLLRRIKKSIFES
jgi:hypothetical protein